MAESPEPTSPPDAIPGRPVPRDQIDPELIALRRPGPRIGPLLALAIVAFCVYLMVALRADLRFSLENATPRPIAEVTATASYFDAHVDHFVSLRAVPDRAFAARITAGEAAEGGHRVAPIMGTSDRLWLYVEGTPWSAAAAYDEVYRGRLRRLADLPFADELAAWVRGQPPQPRYVARAELERGLAGGGAILGTVTGDQVTVAPATPVVVAQRVPERALLVLLQTDSHPDEASWRRTLEAAGFLAVGHPLAASAERWWSFEVDAPGGPGALAARLGEARLFAVRVEPVVRERRAPLGEVRAEGEALLLAGERVPWATIDSVAVEVARTLPAGARVLLVDQHPERYWYVLPVYGLLVLFAALFTWALIRALKRDRTATP